MHDNSRKFLLTFPRLPLSKSETPADLKRLLYKGGASLPQKRVNEAIERGLLGSVMHERVELVCLIHEFIDGLLAGGGSPVTARGQIRDIVSLFAWADEFNAPLSIPELLRTYLAWSEHLLHRVRVVKNLKQSTAYGRARVCGQVLDAVLGRMMPMVELTRLKRPSTRKTPQGVIADKQNLQQTFAFGRMLQDICDGTPLAVVWGPRPVRFPRQDGGEIVLARTGRPALPDAQRDPRNVRMSEKLAIAFEAERSLDHPERSSVVNIRIMAEMLMFIGQTAMGITETLTVPIRRFTFESNTDGYNVLDYKNRAKREVLFRIFGEYRRHFERYLQWRKELFPESEQRLFPLIRGEGIRHDSRPDFRTIEKICNQAGVRWAPPSILRGTRVNWCLRRSGDPGLTAEMAQHTKEVLLSVYERPSLQRSINEFTIFWRQNDPNLVGSKPLLAVVAGECTGSPVPSVAKPDNVPMPDCISPSGCLWCENHRDIDSFDYVWSMACFKHLKVIELTAQCLPEQERQSNHPAELVISRISEKLTWFRDSNVKRQEWVKEALARVDEGSYHDQWSYLIEAFEGKLDE